MLLLASLEVGLRLAGWATLALRARRAGIDAGQDAWHGFLHLGESTTFGLGVAREEAYPAVVAGLLEKRHPGNRFVSVNRGVPGLVTSAMRRTLGEKLAIVHPTLVTIMAGANDFNDELNGLDSRSRTPEGMDFLSALRVYKAGWLALQLMRPDVRLDQNGSDRPPPRRIKKDPVRHAEGRNGRSRRSPASWRTTFTTLSAIA